MDQAELGKRYGLSASADYAVPPAEPNATMDSPIGAYAPPERAIDEAVQEWSNVGKYPTPGTIAPRTWYRRLDADKAARHAVEDQDADGWTEVKGGSGHPTAENPRRRPSPEPRPTSSMSPANYSFTVAPGSKNGDSARYLNGEHFSMADHRRNYDTNLLGTQPVRTWRNTLRISPVPWDMDVTDVPPDGNSAVVQSAAIKGYEVPSSGDITNRSWRI